MNTGHPSRMELSAAAARLDSSCCMLCSAAPGVLVHGMDDCSCLLISSSEKRMGSTQLLYQEQDLHCTNACASSRMSLMSCAAFTYVPFGLRSNTIMDKNGRRAQIVVYILNFVPVYGCESAILPPSLLEWLSF